MAFSAALGVFQIKDAKLITFFLGAYLFLFAVLLFLYEVRLCPAITVHTSYCESFICVVCVEGQLFTCDPAAYILVKALCLSLNCLHMHSAFALYSATLRKAAHIH
jgi:hypothetical protein